VKLKLLWAESVHGCDKQETHTEFGWANFLKSGHCENLGGNERINFKTDLMEIGCQIDRIA
jgi:hypothetical protein